MSGRKDMGACPSGTGLSPSVEPACGLDGSATSIPSAGHTPGPWRAEGDAVLTILPGGATIEIARTNVLQELRTDAEYANAAFIVRACNSHYELLEALGAARNVLANSGAESGYCMCGDPIEGHSFGSGHALVDSHGYMADKVIEQIDAAIAKATGQ